MAIEQRTNNLEAPNLVKKVLSRICENTFLRKYRKPMLSNYDDQQFAYRDQSSTVCALVKLHGTITKHLVDQSVKAVRIIAIDLSKAFDGIPHDLLLDKLSGLSVPDVAFFVNWIKSYLSNRQQRVRLSTFISSLVAACSGVPQGSLLGPYLFALFMRDFCA